MANGLQDAGRDHSHTRHDKVEREADATHIRQGGRRHGEHWGRMRNLHDDRDGWGLRKDFGSQSAGHSQRNTKFYLEISAVPVNLRHARSHEKGRNPLTVG